MTDYSRLEDTDFPPRLTRRLRVAVIGVGALGNAVVQILCLNRVQEVVVVDPDTVEPSDLSRSLFFRHPGSIGRNKAEALAAAAASLFPETAVVPFAAEVADMDERVLSTASLWFSCVDSLLARLEIAYLSTSLRKPVADGALGSDATQGRVSWFPPDAACFSCLLPRGVRARLLSNWQPNASPCGVTNEREAFPSTPSLAAAVAGLQVELGLRSFFEQRPDSFTARLWTKPGLRVDVASNCISTLCPFHWDRDIRMLPVPDLSENVVRFLSTQARHACSDPYLLLRWPLCIRAQCDDCGSVCEPLCRAGLTSHAICSYCGCAALRPIQSVRAISTQSPWAHRSLYELGLRDGLAMIGDGRSVL